MPDQRGALRARRQDLALLSFAVPRTVSAQHAVLTTLLALAVTGVVGALGGALPALVAVAVVTAAALSGRAGRGRHRHREETTTPDRRGVRDMVLHLSPVALLTVAFPVVSGRLAGASISGAPLTTVLLASSLTVPWISQAVCLPLYRGIGHLVLEGDMRKIDQRFCAVWPVALLQSLPVVALFTVAVQLVVGLPAGALAAYAALCVLHVAFAQSLVTTNVGRRRERWALAWAVYAAALLVAPTLWFLPPLAGLAVQLLPMRRWFASTRHLVRLDTAEVVGDLVRGLLLGAVLWSDKLLLFLVTDGDFPVQLVFAALLPSVLAYNYYFVRLAPRFDASVAALRGSMERDTYAVLGHRSRLLFDTVTSTVARTGAVGAVIAVLVSAGAAVLGVDPGLVAAVAIASWLFMMVTVLCYKLDYIGRRVPAQVIGALHLLACVAAFAAAPGALVAYLVLIPVEAALLVAAMRTCFESWRSPEFTLFWRHATAW